tara:strand:+ start:432 stop:1607 length:1176 start_codon:yes stop_codon:yes gene_type:complete
MLLCTFSTTVNGQNPAIQTILDDVEIDSLTFFVRQLSGQEQVIIAGVPDTIHTRQSDQPGNEKAFRFLMEKLASYELTVDSFQFSATGKNVIASKVGSIFPNRKYILGAHYDNVGVGIAPGADDNASGSSAVIEAARIFSEYDFPFTIIFALWDEEEQGLIGSTAYAESAVFNNDSILGYINMDMLGWDGNNDGVADLHVRPVASSIQLADKALAVDTIYNINLDLHIVNPGSSNTDHAPFWDNGFTAIGIDEEYDGDFNPFWHSPADSLAQFNLPFYQKCAKLAYATLADCALGSNSALGVDDKETSFQNDITVYPNPAINNITVDLGNVVFDNIEIGVFNTKGELLQKVASNSLSKIEINVEGLPSGSYYVSILQNHSIVQTKNWIKLE